MKLFIRCRAAAFAFDDDTGRFSDQGNVVHYEFEVNQRYLGVQMWYTKAKTRDSSNT